MIQSLERFVCNLVTSKSLNHTPNQLIVFFLLIFVHFFLKGRHIRMICLLFIYERVTESSTKPIS